jgi:hypothetical protein
MRIVNPVSTLIESQLPEYVRSDHPQFVSFLKAYYEWLDLQGNATYETRKLLDYSDVDSTSEEFIRHFVNTFLPYFPQEILSDKSKLIKAIREFYLKKGSEESLKFLFRVLYNEDIEVLYPKENILIASDGKWNIPRALRLTTANTPASFDVNLLKERLGIGVNSKATCVIESAYRTIDVGTNREIFEVFVSNVKRLFENGENLEVSFLNENGEKVILISEKIIGSLSNIKIDPKNRGLRYETGDPIVLLGGLSEIDPDVLEAKAEVGNVTIGQINDIQVIRGGYGFSPSPNTTLIVIPSPQQLSPPTNATAIVTQVDTGNLFSLQINTDIISEYLTVSLVDSSYGFPNFTSANINTPLDSAFNFETHDVAPIKSVKVTSAGGGYKFTPTVLADSIYTILDGNEPLGNVKLLDLGHIAKVEIVSGGIGYDPSQDKILVTDRAGRGYGANISFTVDGFGVIDSTTVDEIGEGYYGDRNTLEAFIVDSSDNLAPPSGTGAILKVYRYGEGESLNPIVDDIGRIIDFRLISRGSGYVSVPEVSLRVKDLQIQNVGDEISPIIEGDEIYQGANVESFTFYAKIDSFEPATSKLRIFNFAGTLNEFANVVIKTQQTEFNVGVVSVTSYGNGLAKANAQFLNGLVEYSGFYLNTDGFLSADKKLQDAKKYHNFSYVVIAERALNLYRNALLDIAHPAGTRLFGNYQILSKKETEINAAVTLHTTNSSGNTGNITIVSFSNTVNGNDTAFTNSKSTDLLAIGVGDRRQVKVITDILNNTTLNVESGLNYFGDGKLNIVEDSNVISIIFNLEPLALSANDILRFEYSSNTLDAKIISTNINSVTINIANSQFTSSSNVDYEVYPEYINVSYKIISTEI